MTSRAAAGSGSKVWQGAFLAGMALAVLVIAVQAARWQPLWYDELFTLYVASEASPGATLRALLAGADTNPPIDYLLRHASLALLGDSAMAFRWPSALVFVAGLFAIYAFVRRRTGFVPAAAAFALPILSVATYFSHEGRAYALLFASAPIALWAWQRAAERERRATQLLTLFLALCLGPFSHYFGVLNFVAVAAGEAWRSYRRRRLDWGVLGTLAAACIACLSLLVFARSATAMKQAFWAAGYRAADIPDYYTGLLGWAGWAWLAALALAFAAGLAMRGRGPRREPTESSGPPQHEVVAAGVLAMTPLSAFVLAHFLAGALVAKYTIAFVPGTAILFGYLLHVIDAWRRPAALLALGVLALLGLGRFSADAFAYRDDVPVPRQLPALLPEDSALPVAFDSPHLFLETVYYEPQFAAGRFYYPLDAATGLAVRGFNNDEIALRRLTVIKPLNVVDYRAFLRQNREFLVVFSHDFWPGLVKALQRDGYCLQPVAEADTAVLLHAYPGCRG
jgi:Dolichyl-phosphate-mannose-protein mannosyltransferase